MTSVERTSVMLAIVATMCGLDICDVSHHRCASVGFGWHIAVIPLVIPLVYRGVRDPLRAHVEAQGAGWARTKKKMVQAHGWFLPTFWLGLSVHCTGWATVAINRPPAALGAPHAPCSSYPTQGRVGKGLMRGLIKTHRRSAHPRAQERTLSTPNPSALRIVKIARPS